MRYSGFSWICQFLLAFYSRLQSNSYFAYPMLRTIKMHSLAIDPILISEDNIIDKVGNSEVDRIKVGIKMAKSKSQDKSKNKNLVKFFLAKF